MRCGWLSCILALRRSHFLSVWRERIQRNLACSLLRLLFAEFTKSETIRCLVRMESNDARWLLKFSYFELCWNISGLHSCIKFLLHHALLTPDLLFWKKQKQVIELFRDFAWAAALSCPENTGCFPVFKKIPVSSVGRIVYHLQKLPIMENVFHFFTQSTSVAPGREN